MCSKIDLKIIKLVGLGNEENIRKREIKREEDV